MHRPVGNADPKPASRLLICVATDLEAKPVFAGWQVQFSPSSLAHAWRASRLDDQTDLVVTGVGKANAAGGLANLAPDYAIAINLGIAGALPGSGLNLGDVVAATACWSADEGVRTPENFLTLESLGFPLGDFSGPTPVDSSLLERLTTIVSRVGPIASVSTCSGTDELASAVANRFPDAPPIAEDMESAALAQTAVRLGIHFGAVRVISNTTGDRSGQRWDIPRALARLSEVAAKIRAMRLAVK
ncbi:MAG: futalosine hydrolase [Planctomycetota bacterium]|nr:futalosine hydrolase [Planctomycetota bacterium]